MIPLDAASPNLDIRVELVLHSDTQLCWAHSMNFHFSFSGIQFFTGRNKFERAKAHFLYLKSLK